MPTLHLRTLGVSYAIEGLGPASVETHALLDALETLHGEATAPLGVPTEAILIDTKALTWDELQDWLERWVREQGFSYASWAHDASIGNGGSTLHFHV